MTLGIYQIYNKANGKQYIGSSVNIENRWRQHRSSLKKQKHRNSHLQNAWNMYGENTFAFEIIEECSKEELKNKESWYLENTHNIYNLTTNVEKPFLGRKHTEETNRINSEYHKGRAPRKGAILTEETKEKIRKANIGKKQSKETIDKRRKHLIGRPVSEETRRKISESNKGKPVSYETRLKMSESQRGKPCSEKTRELLYSYSKGRVVSDETRKKMSIALKGHKGRIGVHQTKETKLKIGSANKKAWAIWRQRKAKNINPPDA